MSESQPSSSVPLLDPNLASLSRPDSVAARILLNKQRLQQHLAAAHSFASIDPTHSPTEDSRFNRNSPTSSMPKLLAESSVCACEVEIQSLGHVLDCGIKSMDSTEEPIRLPLVRSPPPYTTWTRYRKNQLKQPNDMIADDDNFISSSEELHTKEATDEDAHATSDQCQQLQIIREIKDTLGSAFDEIAGNLALLSGASPGHWKQILGKNSSQGLITDNVSCPREDHGENGPEIGSSCVDRSTVPTTEPNGSSLFEAQAQAAGSFDRLFCRMCYMFGCKLHHHQVDAMQPPLRKQPPWIPPQGMPDSCGNDCFRHRQILTDQEVTGNSRALEGSSQALFIDTDKMMQDPTREEEPLEKLQAGDSSPEQEPFEKQGLGAGDPSREDELLKKQDLGLSDMDAEPPNAAILQVVSTESQEEERWSDLEKSLYRQGVQIFGGNSCLIARNLLKGLRTCAEVEGFKTSAEALRLIHHDDSPQPSARLTSPLPTILQQRSPKSRCRRTEWSAAEVENYKAARKRRSETLQKYSPCNCSSAHCSSSSGCVCMSNDTFCEKFCGCIKTCSNRFRGCLCKKNLCWQSAGCPCFDSGRECDPDVCRNCSLPCGVAGGAIMSKDQEGTEENSDSSRPDGHTTIRRACQNMHLLLKREKRLLLGVSDVAGWGAFLKDEVQKDDFIAEYTGELITYDEVEKRGVLPGREGSFLFDLNNKLAIDAYRHGSQAKFINHSSQPNCYAKVFMVCGDHRIAIVAKKRIRAGEELFFNYNLRGDVSNLEWATSASKCRITDQEEGATTHSNTKNADAAAASTEEAIRDQEHAALILSLSKTATS